MPKKELETSDEKTKSTPEPINPELVALEKEFREAEIAARDKLKTAFNIPDGTWKEWIEQMYKDTEVVRNFVLKKPISFRVFHDPHIPKEYIDLVGSTAKKYDIHPENFDIVIYSNHHAYTLGKSDHIP